MRKIRVTVALALMGVAAMAVWAPSASATYGSGAEYQIAFSQNCNNATYCLGGQGGLGGDWGWAVLNKDGTGDLQITFCGHTPGQGGGAGHASVDIYSWTIDNGVFDITSSNNPEFNGDSPIPAAPGHYNMHPAPGVAIEITVKKLPGS